jgi:hypothetical protein
LWITRTKTSRQRLPGACQELFLAHSPHSQRFITGSKTELISSSVIEIHTGSLWGVHQLWTKKMAKSTGSRRTKKQRARNYDTKRLKKVAARVRKRLVTARVASRQTSIPYTTIVRHAKNAATPLKPGPRTTVPASVENILITWIKERQQIDECPSIDEASRKVEKLMKHYDIMFKNGKYMPGRGWWTSFFRRHPSITLRTATERQKHERASLTVAHVQPFFDAASETFAEHDFEDIQIVNFDETHAPTENVYSKKVLAVTGSENASAKSTDSSLSHVTVFAMVNAAGEKWPLSYVFGETTIPNL